MKKKTNWSFPAIFHFIASGFAMTGQLSIRKKCVFKFTHLPGTNRNGASKWKDRFGTNWTDAEHRFRFTPPASPRGGPLALKIFSQSYSLRQFWGKNPQFEQILGSGPPPSGVKTLLGPLWPKSWIRHCTHVTNSRNYILQHSHCKNDFFFNCTIKTKGNFLKCESLRSVNTILPSPTCRWAQALAPSAQWWFPNLRQREKSATTRALIRVDGITEISDLRFAAKNRPPLFLFSSPCLQWCGCQSQLSSVCAC